MYRPIGTRRTELPLKMHACWRKGLLLPSLQTPEGTPAELYSGNLAGLIQKIDTGRELAGDADEDVEFDLNLPTEAATDLIQGIGIEFDLVFVAVTD